MGFYEWLHREKAEWEINIERLPSSVFKELRMSREEVEKILEKLDEYEVFGKSSRNYY